MQRNYNYSLNSAPFLLGQIYDTSLVQIDCFSAEEDIAFGGFVQNGTSIPAGQGTSASLVKRLTATGRFIGVALRSNIQPLGAVVATAEKVADGSATSQVTLTHGFNSYPAGASVPIMRVGRVAILIPVGTIMTNAAIGATLVWNTTTSTMTFSALPVVEILATAINIGTMASLPVVEKLAIVQINKLL
jgi:hypothetical protein